MRSDKFGSQLERKSKTRFFTFLYVYVSWIKQDKIKILISQLTPAKFRYFADQNGQRRTQWKSILAIFKYKNKYQTVRAQKVDETNGVIWLISFFLSWVMALKLPKIVHFFHICANLSKKPKYIKAIHFYPSERPHHALSENSIFYRGSRF